MSFDRGPKQSEPGAVPNPADDANRQRSAARKRLATGGTRSTFLGRAAQAALPPTAPTVTGV